MSDYLRVEAEEDNNYHVSHLITSDGSALSMVFCLLSLVKKVAEENKSKVVPQFMDLLLKQFELLGEGTSVHFTRTDLQ